MSVSARPLILTADRRLRDDLLQLAATANVETEVAADVGGAGNSWSTAPAIFIGDDLAPSLRQAELTRREGVFLIGHDRDDAEIWHHAFDLGVERVAFIRDDADWLTERFTNAAEPNADSALTICVLGGRGGAGATTLAVALALAGVRRGQRTLLLDGDPLGGGIDLVLGGEETGGLRWPDFTQARGRVNGSELHEALPQLGGLTVLSWDRGDTLVISSDVMRTVLEAAQRTSDLVVVDLPRRLDPAAREALARATVTLLVVPAEVRAVAAAARVAASTGLVAPDLRVVVRGPAPSGLSGQVVAASLELALAGEMKSEPDLAASLERGEPPGRRGRGPLAKFCAEFLSSLVSRDGAGVI